MTMRTSIAAELLVLRKRAATWILLGIWTALGVFFAYVIPYALDSDEATGGVRELLPAALAGTLVVGFPFFGGVFALMLGVFAVGSDYGWDTLKTRFTQGPSRLHVFGAKLAALAIVLLPYVLAVFAAGAMASVVIARIEGASAAFPSAWLLLRAMAAGWLVLAAWAALGVLLGTLTRGTSLAIGVGILYALVVEGLVSALAGSVGVLEPVGEVLLRANGYSIAATLGASVSDIGSNGPGSFDGPFAPTAQAVGLLAACLAAFLAASAILLRRRDVV
jgi:ABC-type transport system involved in multi-copper enzyme maturation permease subunit